MPNNAQYMMNEYAASYMHPNRPSTMSPQQYHQPRPTADSHMPNDFYYQSNLVHPTMHSHPPVPQRHLPNHPSAQFPNLIEVPQSSVPHPNMVDCMRKLPQTQPPDNRRKSAIAVQKGNVLEIVPSAELQCDRNVELMEREKSDKVLSVEKQHQQTLQHQKQERIKRKMERHQRRLAKEKRKQFLASEIERLSNQLIVGGDGKMIKAGELLKTFSVDSVSTKVENSSPHQGKEDQYVEPQTYDYNPNAEVGKSILSERNDLGKLIKLK